jgi:hypothetical protein
MSVDLEFNILAAEQINGSIQRLFVTSGYDVLVFIFKNNFQNFILFFF